MNTQPDTKTIEGKIAVMQAAKEGKRIQCDDKLDGGIWHAVGKPSWNWFNTEYRIHPDDLNPPDPYKPFKDALAAGRRVRCFKTNWQSDPNEFTWSADPDDYEIEPEDPYKPFKDALKSGKRVRCGKGGVWLADEHWFSWHGKLEEYEIEPDSRPWTADDVPSLCWIRNKQISGTRRLVTKVEKWGVLASGVVYTFKELTSPDYEYSTDGKNGWGPCTKR